MDPLTRFETNTDPMDSDPLKIIKNEIVDTIKPEPIDEVENVKMNVQMTRTASVPVKMEVLKERSVRMSGGNQNILRVAINCMQNELDLLMKTHWKQQYSIPRRNVQGEELSHYPQHNPQALITLLME